MISPGFVCLLEGWGHESDWSIVWSVLLSEALDFVWQSAPWEKARRLVHVSITKNPEPYLQDHGRGQNQEGPNSVLKTEPWGKRERPGRQTNLVSGTSSECSEGLLQRLVEKDSEAPSRLSLECRDARGHL